MNIGFVCSGVDDVSSQDRAFYLFNPLIIYGMPRFDVVVAHRLRIILHVVHHRCGQVGHGGLNEIAIITRGLTLKNVAVVEQDNVLAILLAHFVYIRTHSGQRTFLVAAVDKVVRKEASVYVARLYYLDFYILSLRILGKT